MSLSIDQLARSCDARKHCRSGRGSYRDGFEFTGPRQRAQDVKATDRTGADEKPAWSGGTDRSFRLLVGETSGAEHHQICPALQYIDGVPAKRAVARGLYNEITATIEKVAE